jgi:hypothetical protein
MSEFTHFVTDPENPSRAIAFKAQRDVRTNKLYRIGPTRLMWWINAILTEKLTQLEEIPEEKEYDQGTQLRESRSA